MTDHISNNTMKVWNKGRVSIFPHLEFDHLYTYDDICKLVLNIKIEFFGDNMRIYELNSYCNEVNGRWNVCFSLNINGIEYTYMIRRDSLLKKTYGCPFTNMEYGYIGHNILDLETMPKKFIELEKYLMFTLVNPKKIDHFITKL